MTVDSIRAASQAAERWAATLAEVRDAYERHNIPLAYGLALRLRSQIGTYHDVIEAYSDELAATHDWIVRYYHDSQDRQSYASAHEAVSMITRLAMIGLFVGLRRLDDPDEFFAHVKRAWDANDTWQAYTLSSADASDLRARMRCERATLLLQSHDQQPEKPTLSRRLLNRLIRFLQSL